VFADHQADPQKGRAEAERLITQEKVCAIVGTYQSSCGHGQPDLRALSDSVHLGGQFLAEPASSRPQFYFRAAPHDEMFSGAMFDFFDAMKKKGTKIDTLALFHEDTIFGTDSGNAQLKLAGERGYKVVADIKYRSNSPSLSAEVQQLKAANAKCADAVELHHGRHPLGEDHGRTRLQAERDRRAGRWIFRKSAL